MNVVSRIFTITAITLIAQSAFAWEPVTVSTDGKVLDDKGNVIATPNLYDPRNTKYRKYYANSATVCDKGSACTSDFVLIYTPEAGFMKKNLVNGELVEETQPSATPSVSTTSNSGVTTGATSQNGMVTTYGELPKARSGGGIYDNVNNGSSRF